MLLSVLLALLIADVSDKGVPAALMMMSAKVLIHYRACQGGTPARIMEDVNKELCDKNESGMFVTVRMGILDIRDGAMTCVNAGHEYPLVKRAGGAPQMYGSYQWSMEDYRKQLRQYREQNAEGSQEAWDELEKSVVSRVADDVKVSILGRTVEMTIEKRMA